MAFVVNVSQLKLTGLAVVGVSNQNKSRQLIEVYLHSWLVFLHHWCMNYSAYACDSHPKRCILFN